MQTIAEATKALHEDVEAFQAYYLKSRAEDENPDHWPLTMGDGEWFEQFLMFMSNGSRK